MSSTPLVHLSTIKGVLVKFEIFQMKLLTKSSIIILTVFIFLPGCKDKTTSIKNPGEGFAVNKISVPSASEKEDAFKSWVKDNYNNLRWNSTPIKEIITPEILNKSLDLGSSFLINNQKPAGNFNYEYDFVTKTFASGDNQVRQAGALWGISLIYAYNQDPELKKALDKSLEFFF